MVRPSTTRYFNIRLTNSSLEFDLCESCEAAWTDTSVAGNHKSDHPLIKVSRPVIRMDKYFYSGLQRLSKRVLSNPDEDDSSGSSSRHPHDLTIHA